MARAPVPYEVDGDTKIWILRKLLLHWDGQWFLRTVQEYGLDEGIALNAEVRAAFGQIEMRALLRAVGKSQADDLSDAVYLILTYADILMGKGFRAELQRLDSDCADVLIYRCTAFAGAKWAGLARIDQACVACEGLWNAWLEVLLPGVTCDVQYPMRMGKGDAHCHFIIRVRSG